MKHQIWYKMTHKHNYNTNMYKIDTKYDTTMIHNMIHNMI